MLQYQDYAQLAGQNKFVPGGHRSFKRPTQSPDQLPNIPPQQTLPSRGTQHNHAVFVINVDVTNIFNDCSSMLLNNSQKYPRYAVP